MTLQLSLTPELEKRLTTAASQRGKPAEQYAVQLLDETLPHTERNLGAAQMLLAWATEDESISDAESAENEEILRALDEDRLSDRKLFAHLFQGTTP
jgi:hypothetical protein